jgi:hypothetical protein
LPHWCYTEFAEKNYKRLFASKPPIIRDKAAKTALFVQDVLDFPQTGYASGCIKKLKRKRNGIGNPRFSGTSGTGRGWSIELQGKTVLVL